ncbi:esterase/lipase family protein [Vibrio hannami]|uniref:esterase/lipase family protein n=1 Tax=Vibrio hannami TaxID=2717094 RepID=UPI003EBFAEE4
MNIVILHGLYMHGVVMQPLSQKLQALGYSTQIVSYNTVSINEEELFQDIDNALEDSENVLLGHSLGGIMIKRYLASRKPPVEKISHVIALASPIKGASIAEKLQGLGLGAMLGNSVEHGLELHEDTWDYPQLLGSITGNVSVGVRPILIGSDSCDGTVTVEETKIDGMTDHVETKNSHSSILFSSEAIKQIDHFIKNSHFTTDDGSLHRHSREGGNLD